MRTENNNLVDVNCPSNSAGSSIRSGCPCNAGFSGTITASTLAPNYYSGSCTGTAPPTASLIHAVVLCPALSSGSNVPTGCACNAGYTGIVLATKTTPFYFLNCTGAWSSE